MTYTPIKNHSNKPNEYRDQVPKSFIKDCRTGLKACFSTLIAGAIVATAVATTTLAQTKGVDINFDDLKRPGRQLIATQTVSGVESEARQMTEQYWATDGRLMVAVAERRTEAAEASRKYQNEGKAGANRFMCEFRCTVGGLGNSTKPFRTEFRGSTRSEAEDGIKKQSDSLCKKLRGDGAFFKNQVMYATDVRCE